MFLDSNIVNLDHWSVIVHIYNFLRSGVYAPLFFSSSLNRFWTSFSESEVLEYRIKADDKK